MALSAWSPLLTDLSGVGVPLELLMCYETLEDTWCERTLVQSMGIHCHSQNREIVMLTIHLGCAVF